jgi:putative membrane protein
MRYNSNQIAIFLIWLFHISGVVGILIGYEQWFLTKTPLNLGACFLILLWAWPLKHFRDALIIGLWFLIGMTAEWVGVKTGWPFGTYYYGDNLGAKFDGIPYMIGINWAMLTMLTAAMLRKVTKLWVKAAAGAILMVALDFLIEPLSGSFDFWHWEGGDIPIRNYVAWFVIAFVMHLFYPLLKEKGNEQFSIQLYLAQVFFFSVLLTRYVL